mgnify:CR=1 FL=1
MFGVIHILGNLCYSWKRMENLHVLFGSFKHGGGKVVCVLYLLIFHNVGKALLLYTGHIENINVNFEDISEKPAMREKMLKLPETTITSSFLHNLEIGGATTSKAEALIQMGRLLGVEPEEMMAVGDSPNDMAMLSVCGLPVAVGNALDEVKAIARYIAPTNHEDGVADAVEKFVLGETE